MSREPIEYEPALHALVEEFKAKLVERQYGFFLIAASSTHLEYIHNPMPPWSCITEVPGSGISVRCDDDEEERLRASLHVVLGIGDLLEMFAAKYRRNNAVLCEELKRYGITVERTIGADDAEKELEQ